MNPLRKKLTKQKLLEALNHAHTYALPEDAVRPYVDSLIRPELSAEEWQAATADLEKAGAIARVPSDLDPDLVQWAITERGRVLLATL